MRARSLLVLLLAWPLGAAAADHGYFGHHPVPPPENGFCYLAGPHAHPYDPAPAVAPLFRKQGGYDYFVGDPYYFGYTRPALPYDGHHPIHVAFGGGWCYLDGPHYHFFHPHRDDVRLYTIFGGRYYYVGPVAPEYHQQRAIYYIPPPAAGVAIYAPFQAHWATYALQYGLPASPAYVVKGKLPKRDFVPGMYASAVFGLPAFYAGMQVGVPGFGAQVGVAMPGFSAQVGFAT